MRTRRIDSQGFTLLETMIAVAIMMVAFASILMVESSSIQSSIRTRQMNVVAMLAKNKMVEAEYLVEGKAFAEIKPEEKGQFTSPFEDYSWERTVKEVKFPELNIGSAQAGGEGSTSEPNSSGGSQGSGDEMSQFTKLMTQYLSKSVRELTVTIRWKRGSGEQAYSVSTYWVNLNSDFQIN